MNPETPTNPAPNVPQPQPSMPAQQPVAMPPASPAMQPKKKSKNMLYAIIAIAVVAIALIGFGVFALVEGNKPENLINAAVQNLSTKKALAATFKLTNGTEQSGVTFNGTAAVAADPANNKNGELIMSVGTGTASVKLDALMLDGNAYFRLHNFENIGEFLGTATSSTAKSMYKNVNEQWFELDKDQVKSVAESTGNDQVSGAVSPDDLRKVLDIYKQHSFVKADKTYNDEAINGKNCAHFSIKLDRNEYVAFVQAVKAANLKTITISDDDVTKARSVPETPDGTFELWITRDSKEFRQVKMANAKKGEEATIVLTFSDTLPSFDKFEKPASTKPIADFMTVMLGSAFSNPSFDAMSSDSSLLQ